MAITLVEAAKLSQNQLQKGVLETFIQTSPLLDRIPFMEIEGNAFAYNEEGTLPGVEFRAVNGSYSESTGTVNQKTETLTILGGDADVDTFIQKTRSNFNDQRAVQTAMKVKAASYKYQDTFINGDVAVDANSFDGLKKRLVGAQVLTAPGANGSPVFGANSDTEAFWAAMDDLIAAVPGLDGTNGAIYAPTKLLGKIRSAGRRAGGTEIVKEDLTGKRVLQWNGIPVLELGTTAAGVDILPLTETKGSSNATGSIYAVRFGQNEGEQAVTGLTNGGVSVRDLGEQQSKPAFRTRIEFFTGLGVFGGKAAARSTGWLNS
ncbi:major capsid protein [Arthrobacter woluwensis]|uniref:major capsid protein n=1 Tax=Arthrobacter woluwensis TaxID=156980 RepID=UPI0037FA2BA5